MKSEESYYLNLRKKVGHGLLVYPAAVAAILNEKNEVLLVKKRKEKLWGFPGGGIEPNETAHEALIREAKEEINCEVKIGNLIALYTNPKYDKTYHNGDRIHPIMIFFRCSITSKGTFQPSEEIEEMRYFSKDELPQMHECCVRKAKDLFSALPQVIVD